ncbi:MAG: hypothetical protein Tsb009_32310 [Planctomycetaceae bacterium]
MRRHHFTTRTASHNRVAFTLLELLIVISIIALLAALLTPALYAVFTRTKEARVRAEITGLENALNDFKGHYKTDYPPSSIKLYENKAGWDSDPAARKAIRRIFGLEFNFNTPRAWIGGGATGRTLNGSECLVFFLGGRPQLSGSTWILHGFSKSKADPFKLGGSNRIQFFTEFAPDRLSDNDGDGFPEYNDIFNEPSRQRPYLYASTTRTGAYVAGDLAPSGMTSVYHQGSASNPWKKGAFQIISPGQDHSYGTGGSYTEEDGAPRNGERDNLTNFASGVLGP